MRLSDIVTSKLLPAFALDDAFIQSMCGTIDMLLHAIDLRLCALPLENSDYALSVCRNDELSQLASDLGVIPYYPDLSREVREDLIKKSALWTWRAGTNETLKTMVDALFGSTGTVVNDRGTSKLAHHYDLSIPDAQYTELSFKRLADCIQRVGHVTATPDAITIKYSADITHSVVVSGNMRIVMEGEINV